MRGLVLALALLPATAMAQTDDKGYLTSFLESSLSSAGRTVVVTGFSGALSSKASVQELTIADDQGVWLTLRDVVLDWNRSALFSGDISVNALTANEIVLDRMPIPEEGLPKAEATPLALPELPVSVVINALVAKRIVLGETVLGTALVGRMDASMSLAGGEGRTDLTITRTDTGPAGMVKLAASYATATQDLAINLEAREAAGGIAAGLLGVPGEPSSALTIKGAGPISDFTADVRLETDGAPRLAGQVKLLGQDDGGLGFAVDLGGDIAPLFVPEYAAFFGPSVTLDAEGRRWTDGRVELSRMTVAAEALALDGSVAIGADGVPEQFDVTGQIGFADGAAVLLPLTTAVETRIEGADLSMQFDAAVSDQFTLKATITSLDRADFKAEKLALTGSGRIGDSFDAAFGFAADGLAPADPGLMRALGSSVTGAMKITRNQGDGVTTLPQFAITGDGYEAKGHLTIAGLETALTFAGQIEAKVDNLARLSDLAGQDLGGAASVTLEGSASPLSGAFDLTGAAVGTDMQMGIAEVDNLLRGAARVDAAVVRDTTGTRIKQFDITASTLELKGSGQLASAGSDVTATVRFDDIAVLGPGYGGTLAGTARFLGTPQAGQLTLEAKAQGLAVGQPEVDGLLAGESDVSLNLGLTEDRISIRTATVSNAQVVATVGGHWQGGRGNLDGNLRLDDLSVLGPGYRGALDATLRFNGTAADAEIGLSGTGRDLAVGQAEVDAVLRGQSTVAVQTRYLDGALEITKGDVSNPQASASVTGLWQAGQGDLAFTAALRDLSTIRPGTAGSVSATGTFRGSVSDTMVTASATTRNLSVGQPMADGFLAGDSEISLDLGVKGAAIDIHSAGISNPQVAARVTGTWEGSGGNLNLVLEKADMRAMAPGYRGTFAGTGQFSGTLADGRIAVAAKGQDLAVGQVQADRLLRGESTVYLDLALMDGTLNVTKASLDNPQLAADASGRVTGDSQTVDLTAEVKNLGLVLPEFPGALRVSGRAVRAADGTTLDLRAKGPGRIDAAVKGVISPRFDSGDLAITGTGQAGLANAFIGPRVISGATAFDLRLRGALNLSSLSGTIRLSDGRLADPGLNFALQDMTAQADLAGGQARVSGSAAVSTGGRIDVAGTVGLAAPNVADLTVNIDKVILRDPDLYETDARGSLTVKGPLAGGAVVAGRIKLKETEVRVPSTGFGGAGDLPGLEHVNESAAERATRARAGLIDTGAQSGAVGVAYGLDLTISAPNRLFIRGRGLDAELGGELQLRGTTAAVVPSGAFNLIRGRLDILGKRLVLSEALLQLEGDFVPFLRVVASSENDGITSSVVIEGPASEPVVSFSSQPPLPQEEVLAQLFFGQTLTNLSALQALQLASAIGTLAGRGGDGVVGKLRKGVGLDNLDVKTATDGTTSVTAGKYLSKKIYSEVTVDANGQSEINLNFDLRPSVTLRGRAGSDGSTGFGIFLEKDY